MTQVLLVEDNDVNREMMRRRLQRRGYEVVEAVNGEEAIARAHDGRPAIILMDMSLPVIDGWDATTRLKADAATRSIPIIGLTAHAMVEDREKAIQAGCDEYMTKPVEFNNLVAMIERFTATTDAR